MKSLLKSEWIKIRSTKIWWLLIFSPLLVGITGMTMPMPEEGPQWVFLLSTGVSIHALLFLPLMVAVFSAYICRYEHQHNAWKQLFTMPVSRRHVFMAKYVIVALVIAVNQCLFFLIYFGVGFTRGLEGTIPWEYLFRSLAGGWVATLPLAALTLWVALIWSSFAAAITVNVILTMPNMFVVNSETFGPLYPWAQPFLMMLPQSEGVMGGFFVSVESMMVAVIGGFLVFFIGGLTSIHRKVV